MLIALVVILSFCGLHFVKEVRRWEGNFVHGLELKYLDHKFQSRGPVPVNPKVVIAGSMRRRWLALACGALGSHCLRRHDPVASWRSGRRV